MCGAGLVIPEITCFDHQSDWEGVTVVVNSRKKLVAVHYAAHSHVVSVPWPTLREALTRRAMRRFARRPDAAKRPFVFVARGTPPRIRSRASRQFAAARRCSRTTVTTARTSGPRAARAASSAVSAASPEARPRHTTRAGTRSTGTGARRSASPRFTALAPTRRARPAPKAATNAPGATTLRSRMTSAARARRSRPHADSRETLTASRPASPVGLGHESCSFVWHSEVSTRTDDPGEGRRERNAPNQQTGYRCDWTLICYSAHLSTLDMRSWFCEKRLTAYPDARIGGAS